MNSFYARGSQKCKKTDNLTIVLMLLGPVCIKAACRMLMKLTPDGMYSNFHIVMSTNCAAVVSNENVKPDRS